MDLSPTNVCNHKYVDEKGFAVMLAVKRPVGVAPEMNLRNTLHTGDKASEESCSFETWNKMSSKRFFPPNMKKRTGVTKKVLCPQKMLKKEIYLKSAFCIQRFVISNFKNKGEYHTDVLKKL